MTESELIAQIERHCEVHDGFPRPDWDEIARCIGENYDEAEQEKAWNIATDVWLSKIGRVLGNAYWLGASDNFLVLPSESESYARNLLEFLENTLSKVLTAFDGIASDKGYGKHVAIILDTLDDYYLYTSYFYPEEGEFPASSGAYLDKGYGHFALPHDSINQAESIVAHELTHACLGHLPIPLWLNEGIAVKMEHAIKPHRDPFPISEMITRHKRFWNKDKIQQFWTGDSWGLPGAGNELSYHLAQLAVGALSHSYDRFRDFVLLADWQDGGEPAAKDVLGASLGIIMEQFLGPGNWAPSPEKWPDKDHSKISLLYGALNHFQRLEPWTPERSWHTRTDGRYLSLQQS